MNDELKVGFLLATIYIFLFLFFLLLFFFYVLFYFILLIIFFGGCSVIYASEAI